jgi:hypothetical protein
MNAVAMWFTNEYLSELAETLLERCRKIEELGDESIDPLEEKDVFFVVVYSQKESLLEIIPCIERWVNGKQAVAVGAVSRKSTNKVYYLNALCEQLDECVAEIYLTDDDEYGYWSQYLLGKYARKLRSVTPKQGI